ncbi:MAG: hypothetical protein LW828_01075 [Xanthomonadaceae bacterium]|nr:hypothetical protein [Xanthomonadaceae bacterium]MCZ8319934.1 hypothetical protein [Silanimonas sp.]
MEAQPGTAGAPGGRHAGLLEALEQSLARGIVDADPGVRDDDAPTAGRGLPLDDDANATRRGELHRVAHEVQHDLLQPERIDGHPRRQRRPGIQLEQFRADRTLEAGRRGLQLSRHATKVLLVRPLQQQGQGKDDGDRP